MQLSLENLYVKILHCGLILLQFVPLGGVCVCVVLV